MKKDNIKNQILECLNTFGCALQSQILNYLNLEDARYCTDSIKDLLNESKIMKILYRGFDFYIIPGNESEVKRKVRVIKSYIKDIVKNYGPIRSKQLATKLKENFGYHISSLMVYRLAKELVYDNEISSIKYCLANIYYEKDNQLQENKVKKIIKHYGKKKSLKNFNLLYKNYCNQLIIKNNLSSIDKENLEEISSNFNDFFFEIESLGRSYKDFIKVLFLLLIKRKVFLLIKQRKDYEFLEPWLKLHEIILKDNLKRFQGFSFKTYQFFIKQILNNPNFCEKKNRTSIFNSPNGLMRMKFLTSYLFDFDTQLTQKIYKFIERKVTDGFRIDGKDIKGVLAGAIYLVSKIENINLPQKEISSKLGITEVTLRARKSELNSI